MRRNAHHEARKLQKGIDQGRDGSAILDCEGPVLQKPNTKYLSINRQKYFLLAFDVILNPSCGGTHRWAEVLLHVNNDKSGYKSILGWFPSTARGLFPLDFGGHPRASTPAQGLLKRSSVK